MSFKILQKRLLSSLPRCTLPLLHFDPAPAVNLNRVAYKMDEVGVSLPVIIVVPERCGVDDQIKKFARKISDGAITSCVLPDLYNGKTLQGINERSNA
jgi:dienelactone hydrolase